VTNTRVRSSTPRTAHKLNSKFGSRSENHSKAAAASISHQQQHKNVDEALSNNESEVNPSSAAPVWASQAKNALGPLLASHLSKLGPSSVNSNGHHCPVPKSKESEFQAAVSEFAEKIIDNAAANVKEQNVNPDLINHLWNEVLEVRLSC
jgi:chorismate mutase